MSDSHIVIETCPRCGCIFGSHWSTKVAALESELVERDKWERWAREKLAKVERLQHHLFDVHCCQHDLYDREEEDN